MEAALIMCLSSRNVKNSTEASWALVLVNSHFFRLQLEAPKSADAASICSSLKGSTRLSPVIEIDVSVPPGFGDELGTCPVDSFLATLPGSASHHPPVPASSSAGHSNAEVQPRSRPFREDEWERVQEANSQLIEKLERIAGAAMSDESHAAAKSVEGYLDCVLEALERFGEKVIKILTKAKGKAPAAEGWETSDARVDLDDEGDDPTDRGGPNDDVVVLGSMSALETQARDAEGACATAQSVYSVLLAWHKNRPPAGSLLRWCSVVPLRESSSVVMAFDVLALAAGNLEAVQSFGLLQPLLIVVMQFSSSDWATWMARDNGGRECKLPKPGSIHAFQSRTADEAWERVVRQMKTKLSETGVRSEEPLAWWSTAVVTPLGITEASAGPDAPESSSDCPTKKRSLEIEVAVGAPLTLSSWVDLVVDSVMKGAHDMADPSHVDAVKAYLEAALPKLHLVVQDQVKEQQKKALQKAIPGMIERFLQDPGVAQQVPEEQRPVDDDDCIPTIAGNRFLALLLFIANEIRCQHLKCPSCGGPLPAGGNRLRSCTNSLCLYNSEELGPNICVLSELHRSQDAAEFQLDLAFAAARESSRDVFEPFPSFLLKQEDRERGRAGWFESRAGPRKDPPTSRDNNNKDNRNNRENKDLETAETMIEHMPPMAALASVSSTESSLKLQLGASWVIAQVLKKVPISNAKKSVKPRKARALASAQNANQTSSHGASSSTPVVAPLIGEEHMKYPFQLHDFLRFVLFTSRLTLMPLSGTPFELPTRDMRCAYQFMVLQDSPERQAYYEQRKLLCGGKSTFAFHGSSACNWFSILRNGLRSMSNTHFMSAGAAYGEGIYLATAASTSLQYAHRSFGRKQGKLASAFKCLAICELLLDTQVEAESSRSILVVPRKEEANIFIRYLLVIPDAVHGSSMEIKEGKMLQQRGPPPGGDDDDGDTKVADPLDLQKHLEAAAAEHATQVQAEKEKVWGSRMGVVRFPVKNADLCGAGGSKEGKTETSLRNSLDDVWYASEEDEEEYDDEEEEDDDDDDYGAVELPDDPATPGQEAKESEPMDWMAAGQKFGQGAAGLTSALTKSNESRATTSAHAIPTPSSWRTAPGHGVGSSGKSRPPSAMKAVQQEFRKLSLLQDKGNDSLKKGCFEVALPNEADFFHWHISLGPAIFADTPLERDLEKAASTQGVREVPVRLEVLFPDDFPFDPPFVRVVAPRFAFHTGHITVGGSICMELLTASGWSPAYTMEAVFVQVIAEMCAGGARLDPAYMRPGSGAEYSMREAKDAFTRVAALHGWKTS